jgi:hypothetical protein
MNTEPHSTGHLPWAGLLDAGKPTSPRDDHLDLDSCPRLERIAVKTRNSVYEIVVLSGASGTIVLRGGRRFPEFRRATLVGSVDGGGSAVKVRAICVGLCLELRVDGKRYTTSRVEAVQRIA